MGKRLKHSRYITGFDGIRSLAVIGVILYHLLPTQMRGGYLGVPVFFCGLRLFDHGFAAAGMEANWSYRDQAILLSAYEASISGASHDACGSFSVHNVVSTESFE